MSSKPQGKRFTFSTIPIKKVTPGAIAPEKELVPSGLTIVGSLFKPRPKPEKQSQKKPEFTVPVEDIVTPLAPPITSQTSRLKKNIPPPEELLPKLEEVQPQPQPQPELEEAQPQLEEPQPQLQPQPQPQPQLEETQPQPELEEAPKKTKRLKLRRPKLRYSAELEKVKETIQSIEQHDPYIEKEELEPFVPQDRKSFTNFIISHYGKFGLPAKLEEPDLEACQKMGAAGEDSTQIYLYQQFVRNYIRQASPYRGLLVYHGLGSGKTCSAIAAMEALYGINNKKIVVMTPFSLQNNFLTEITFCGFKHYRLQNHWVRVELESDPTATLFAKEVMKIPDTFFDEQKRKKQPKAFYVPDFEKPPNFNSLDDDERSAIREQIFAILRARITFIAYNGISASSLKMWACTAPDYFDNSVIIIDEVHNLTRLMEGTIEPYLAETKKTKRKIKPEPVEPGRWKPNLCNTSLNYKRAFLFYRILCGAKNSKIIALSGTPIVNFPQEIGILANILHGYIDSVSADINIIGDKSSEAIEKTFLKIASKHPRIDYFSIKRNQAAYNVVISAVQEGYIKVFDESGKLKGLEYVGDEAHPVSIQDIYEDISKQLIEQKITLVRPIWKALPVLPYDGETFQKYFIDTLNFKMNNEIVLSKRLSGLISYYKGSKVEFMPRVTRDEYVNVPFTEFSLIGYLKARRYEQEKEDKKKQKAEGSSAKVLAAWAEVLVIAKMAKPSSYRFRSRAACNFVFPEMVKRPFPDNEFDLEEELGREVEVLGDQEADAADDDAASQAAAEEDRALDEEEGAPASAAKPIGEAITYSQRIKNALEALRVIAPEHFKLEPSEPSGPSLKNYSPKYAEIIKRINVLNGSALVYSNFLTLEGIGLFGVALEANGYIPLEILGSDANPYFSPRTEESLRRHFKVVVAAEENSNNSSDEEEENNNESNNESSVASNNSLKSNARRNLLDKEGMTEVYDPVDESIHKKALGQYLEAAYPPNSRRKDEIFSVNELWSKHGFDVWDVLKITSPPSTNINIEDFRPKESIFSSSTHIEALTRYYKTVDPSKATSSHIYQIWKKYGVGIWNAIKEKRPTNMTIEDFRPKGLDDSVSPSSNSESEDNNNNNNVTEINKPTDEDINKEALKRYYETVDPSKATQEHIDKIWSKYGFGIWDAIKRRRPTNITIEDFRPKELVKNTIAPKTGGVLSKNRYILYSGNESRERRNLLINIFNARFDRLPPRIAEVLRESGFEGPTNKKGDICKVIGITGAGAEGLSLKNVRSVHIMEPFWNPVRTDQVKGRAVRICSHSELPVEDRTVEVFTYVSIVSQEMISKRIVDESFMLQDGGLTSDQYILNISQRKKAVSDDLLRVMKQSAVDCVLNSSENNTSEEIIQCFTIQGSTDDFLYNPVLEDDIAETARSEQYKTPAPATVATQTQAKTMTITYLLIRGKKYAAKEKADGSFDLYNMEDLLFRTKIGERKLNPDTGKFVSTFI